MAGRLAGARVGLAAGASLCALAIAPAASHAVPSWPVITEPSGIGTIVNAEDVHMEAYGFSDDVPGAVHQCSTWRIQEEDTGHVAWRSGTPIAGESECVTGVLKNHIHFGDGTFVDTYAGRTSLHPDVDYRLFVNYRNDLGELGPAGQQPFRTATPAETGTARDVPWLAAEPGFAIEEVAGGLALPMDVAMVPSPGSSSSSPLAYVAELYGSIKVVRRDGSVATFADGLLDFDSTGVFPGGGEFGLGGIAVQPGTGDVFFSTPYFNEAADEFFAKVIRLDTTGDGSTQAGAQTILDLGGVVGPSEPQAASHQISNLSFGPDGNLYLNHGDGFDIPKAQDPDSYLGKVLRFDPATGSPVGGPEGNPHYDPGDGITARDYVYARGFRNHFGGAWRASNDQLYIAENGPSVDRFARVDYPVAGPGVSQNFGYDGSDASMATFALYNWPKAVAPVGMTFVESATFGGSGFPASKLDHAFVAESGPTYATGRQTLGKRISEFAPAGGGELAGPPTPLVTYDGLGKASAVGIAAGPDGLYFSELYRDMGYTTPIDPGARLFRVSYHAPSQACTLSGRTLQGGVPSRERAGAQEGKGQAQAQAERGPHSAGGLGRADRGQRPLVRGDRREPGHDPGRGRRRRPAAHRRGRRGGLRSRRHPRGRHRRGRALGVARGPGWR